MNPKDVVQEWRAKSTELDAIFKRYVNTAGEFTGDPSAEDQVKITSLQKEITSLKSQYETATAFTENAEALKKFETPVGLPRFPGAPHNPHKAWEDPDDLRRQPRRFDGSLKYIDVHPTRQENEETAYRFAQWIFASQAMFANTDLQIKALEFCASKGIKTTKTMLEGVNEQGGALVPTEFDNVLIRLMERFGVIRQSATIKQMGSDMRSVPRRVGGVTANWVGEGGTIAESSPTYDTVSLVAKKLATLTAISSEVQEDSAVSIADELAFECALAFATAEDKAAFIGDASPTYGGITGITQKLKGLSATIANIAGLVVASGNLFSEVILTDFNSVVALLPEFADGPNTAWYMHRTLYYNFIVKLLQTAAGGATISELQQGQRAPRPLFLGYPVVFTQAMPKIDANSQVAALLGDLRMGCFLGDRRRRTLFLDPYSLLSTDMIQVRATERVDFNFHSPGNATATAADKQPGPVVGLISAAS